MTIIRVPRSLVLDIPSRFIERGRPAALSHRWSWLFRSLAGGIAIGAVTCAAAAAGQTQFQRSIDQSSVRDAVQIAQASTLQQGQRPSARNTQVKQTRAHCRKISRQFQNVIAKVCIRGDRLDRARNLCVPPSGIFKLYSRWDPAAGRCKPRHRCDGGTCAGGKRRYRAGKHYAHEPSQSMSMYAKAPTRLAAALKSCRRGAADPGSRTEAGRIVRLRRCANARQQNNRNLINLYCR